MLKTNSIYFFDLLEFEEIIIHYLDVGKHSLAKKAVKLGLQQHPESVDLKLLQVEIYIFENEIDKATSLLKKIEIIEPNNDEVYIQKATINSKKGNHQEAIDNFKKALTFTDDKADIWSLLGMEFLYLDDYENARFNFEKCLQEDIEDYAALYNLMYCFDMDKEHELAIRYLNEYIDKNPYCEIAWHQLGRQYFILKMFTEALTSFDYSVLIDESFIGGYLEKAKTLEALERYQEAIDNYLITLELDDPTAFAYVRIGECYQNLEKNEAAISYYKKAVHEDPLLERAWMLLTNLFFEEENYQKAAYFISKALKIDDENIFYWRKYSEINLKLNFFEEAIEGFQKCLALNDDGLEIYVGLADVLTFLGEFTEALDVLELAKETYTDFPEINYRLTGLYTLLNKNKLAKVHFIKGLEVDYEFHFILKELFPTAFENKKIQKLLFAFKKATQ